MEVDPIAWQGEKAFGILAETIVMHQGSLTVADTNLKCCETGTGEANHQLDFEFPQSMNKIKEYDLSHWS
jgi:hypothetical protein